MPRINLFTKILRKAGAVQAGALKAPKTAINELPTDSRTGSTGPYRTDAPIEREEFDLFDRAPFASRIAETIGGRIDPTSLVVAVYGPWGDGKTTVLNFIRNRLRQFQPVITVDFNPWLIKGE